MWILNHILLLTTFLFGVSQFLSYAHATEPASCKITKANHEFDLGDLASRDYWFIDMDTLHSQHKEYYISICHPLRNVPITCPGNNSGICSITVPDNADNATTNFTTVHSENIGDVPSTFEVADMGRLVYSYDSGEMCDDTRSLNYRAEIHLICPLRGVSDSSGPVLMNSGRPSPFPQCNLLFAWMTKAACPKKLEYYNATTCTVKFSNSDHILNLHTLHSPSYYNVSGDKQENYELNICGPVTNGHCGNENATICKLTSSGAVVMGSVNDMELSWKDDQLVLAYKYGNESVEIYFHCDRTATTPQIYYHSSAQFYVKTAAVCTPQTPQCVVSDWKGAVYDLRPLHKPVGNWKVMNKISKEKTFYHINICGKVNEEEYYHCPPGPIGACQAGLGESSAYNLGFLTSHPTVNKDGTITVLYTGGDPCKNGTHVHSTRIVLFCSPEEHGPYLFRITDTCEHIIYWHTPAACPRHLTTGSNCQVLDPLYGNLYNLTTLRGRTDYNVSDGIHSYLVNICGPLVSECEGGGSSSICQVKGKQQFSAGLASSNVTFNDGTLTMRFTNGAVGCHDNITRSTQIIFMCDHEESGFDGPVFIQEDLTSCTYHFIWRTREACPPFSKVDCSYVATNGSFYDLSELSSSIMNVEYFAPNHSKKYVLNVCRSIVHAKDSRCPYKSAACIIDLENKEEAISLGEVESGPFFENGKLLLKYPRGDTCEANPSLHSETIIEFRCDPDELIPYPQLIGIENCKYIFEWSTSLACPVTTPATTTNGLQTGENCTVTNPKTDYAFDLNSLRKDSGYDVQGKDGFHIMLNVCDRIKTSPCRVENVGACALIPDSSGSAGEANSYLHYLPGFLFLRYDEGAVCQNGLKRSTFVNFFCGAEGSNEEPVLIDDNLDKCNYYINWPTELACERRINCYVDTWERRIDLSPLIRKSGNYETSNPNNTAQKFYLNVCRPLNPIGGLMCHPGSSACLEDSAHSSPLNLGHPTASPVSTYDPVVQLMYTAGSVCPSNSHLPITTKISFRCDKNAGVGNPVFTEITHDCQYMFEWKTSVVCDKPEEIPESGPVCQIMFEEAKTNVDLKPLQKSGGYEVLYGNRTFLVNVCGSACNDSGVCSSRGESYGLSSNSELKWDYKKLRLSYFGGDSCRGSLSGHKSTRIYFECDMKAGYGVPVADSIMDHLPCSAIFRWKTNVTCMEGIYSTDAPRPKYVPPTPSMSSTTSSTNSKASTESRIDKPKDENATQSTVTSVVASVIVVSGIVFVIILVLFKSRGGKRAVASFRRLLGLKGYSDISQSQAENSTLLGTTRVFRVDDSDDDLLRI